MAITAKGETPSLSLRQQRGRAVNAVAELLQRKLSVPNIYLEPDPQYIAADVLAVDRAGAGDLHAVKIKLEADLRQRRWKKPVDLKSLNAQKESWCVNLSRKVREIHGQLMALPAHYRYLAVPRDSLDLVMGELGPLLYSPDGIGRLGVVAITDRGEDLPTAEVSIAPERFRIEGARLTRIEKDFLKNKKVRPDIEVRI